MKWIRYFFCVVAASMGTAYAFEHTVINNTNFPIRVSLDYRSAFCRNENAQLIGPGQRRTFGAGICMLTAVVPWFSDEPREYPEASRLAKAAGVLGKDARWFHGGFSGNGAWVITWDQVNNRMVNTPHLNSLGSQIATGFSDLGTAIVDTLRDDIGIPLASILGTALADLVTMFDSETPPPFCFNPGTPGRPAAEATVDAPEVIAQDTDGMIPLIKKYAPLLRLHPQEKAFPISAPEYFTDPQTEMRELGSNKIIIPAGQVTMKKIYDTWKQNPNSKYYFHVRDCVTRGANPALSGGSEITTPVYVQTFSDPAKNKIYLRYVFLYGFNAPYKIKNLLQLFQSNDKARDTANAHIADLEHITVELDATTKKPTRIYYASHGSKEGFWLNADDRVIKWHDTTHPIVFIAKGGHGSYPEEKTYVRVYGFANDETRAGAVWNPKLVRVYAESDPRFNPAIHGWTYHAGQLSRDGVGSFHAQFKHDLSVDEGSPRRPYNAALACTPGNQSCITSLGTRATPPE